MSVCFITIKIVELLFSCLSHAQLLCNSIVHSPPGSSVHGISQARILEWVVISFSRGSSQPRDQTYISSIEGRSFTTESPGKPQIVERSCKHFMKNLRQTKVNSLKQLATGMFVQIRYCTSLRNCHTFVFSSQLCMSIKYLMEKLVFFFGFFFFLVHIGTIEAREGRYFRSEVSILIMTKCIMNR